MPGADRLGPIEGTPPAAPACADTELKGGCSSTRTWSTRSATRASRSASRSGSTRRGVITGAKLVEHHEPIVLIGIPPEKIEALIDRFAGQDMLEPAPAGQKLDIISGATVTVMVIDDSVRGSAQRMARSRVQLRPPPAPTGGGADHRRDGARTCRLGSAARRGAVAELRLTVADVDRALAQAGAGGAPAADPSAADATFIELYAGLVSIPSVGRSLLGRAATSSWPASSSRAAGGADRGAWATTRGRARAMCAAASLTTSR